MECWEQEGQHTATGLQRSGMGFQLETDGPSSSVHHPVQNSSSGSEFDQFRNKRESENPQASKSMWSKYLDQNEEDKPSPAKKRQILVDDRPQFKNVDHEGNRFGNVSRFHRTNREQTGDRNGCHGRMARGGHGLSKVSLWPAMPYPFTPCGRITPETACSLLLFPWTPQAVRLCQNDESGSEVEITHQKWTNDVDKVERGDESGSRIEAGCRKRTNEIPPHYVAG
jgi:hypothetical protein